MMIEAIRIQIYNELNRRLQHQDLKELTRDFLTKNLFRTDEFGSLRLSPIMGYVVLEIPTSKRPNPEIKKPETFDNKNDALAYARELYSNAEDNFIEEVCFEGIIGFEPLTKNKSSLTDDESKNIELLIEENFDRIYKAIKDLANKYDDTNSLNYIQYANIEEAEKDFIQRLDKNRLDKAKNIHRLMSDKTGSGKFFIMDKDQWEEETRTRNKKAPAYPKIPKTMKNVANIPLTKTGFLMHMYDYLFNQEDTTIAEALAIGHGQIYPNYKGAKAKRTALDGSDVISITQDSNFRETIFSMAEKGFNMQPIVDDNKRCIGAIRLQDVLRYISDNGADSLPETFELKTLDDYKLLHPVPPMLDWKAPVSQAEHILKSGIDGILIRFDPKTSRNCPEIVSETLSEGLHIITAHDLAAYHLTKR